MSRPFAREQIASIVSCVDAQTPQAPVRLTPGQIRAARGMLDWGRLDLAAAAGLSISTVKRAEDASPEPVSGDVHAAIRSAFEAKGVRFLGDDGAGPGLRGGGHPRTP